METPRLAELNGRAWSLHRRDPVEALTIAREVRESAEQCGNAAEAALAACTAGACHFELGELDEARQLLSQAVRELAQQTGEADPESSPRLLSARGEACRLLARLSFMASDYEPAIRFIHEAVDAFESANDNVGAARAQNDAGTLHAHLGAFQQGLEYLLTSLRRLEEEGVDAAGGPLNNIGNIHMIQGDPEQALIFFERAFQVFERDGSGRDRVIALGNIARACGELGDLERAVVLHEQALALVRQLNDTAYLPATLGKYATALGKRGRVEQALEVFDEALASFRQGEAPFKDEILLNLADLHLDQGAPEKAEPLLLETLQLAKDSGNRPIMSSAHEGLSRALETQERWREALHHFREFHRLDLAIKEELFSSRTQVLLLQHELNQSRREGELLRNMNAQLNDAFGELQTLHQELEKKSSELEFLSLTDPLTRLSNRRHLEKRLEEEMNRLQRSSGVFSVIMTDIDDFKSINDSFTHAKGDEILVEFARLLRENTRQADIVARVGGEEFVLILPETALEDALAVAEKLRVVVEGNAWDRLQPGLRVTMSAGVSEARSGDTIGEVLRDADRGLYRAKHLGKNVVCWEYDRIGDPG